MVVKRLDERDKLRFVAEAGIKRAIVELGTAEEKTYEAFNDTWSSNVDLFRDFKVNDGMSNICYNYFDEKTGAFETRYGLIDEERKININKANREVLERLFQITAGLEATEAQELAASIVDWRDADSELSIALGSAEDFYYRGLPAPYEAKDSNFESLEEVLLVKGMTKDVFEKTRDYITVYGDGRVNINTTSGVVLLALGVTGDMVNKIMALLYGKDGVRGDGDDVIFTMPGTIVPALSQAYHLTDSQIAQLSVIADQNLDTRSNFFTIKEKSRLEIRETSIETTCVVDKTGKVLYWREG